MHRVVPTAMIMCAAACSDAPPRLAVPVAAVVAAPPPASAEAAVPPPEPLPKGVLRRLGTRRDRCVAGNAEIRYASNGRLIATESVLESRWSEDRTFSQVSVVSIRELDTGQKLFSTEGHHGLISPSGDGWVELSKPVKLWSFSGSKPPVTLRDSYGSKGAWIQNGREVAFLDYGQDRIVAWNPSSGATHEIVSYEGVVHSVAGAALGSAVAIAFQWTPKVVVVDNAGQQHEHELPEWRCQLAFDAHGKFLAVATGHDLIGIDIAAKKRTTLAQIPTDDDSRQLAVSPDGELMAVGAQRRVVIVNRAGTTLHDWSLKGHVRGLAFSADGAQLAVREWNGIVRRFDPSTGKQVDSPPGHDALGVVALSPSGRRAITAGGRIHLWDVDEGTLVRDAPTAGQIVAASFVSEDVAVTFSNEGQLVRWSLPKLVPTVMLGEGYYSPAPGFLSGAPAARRFIAPARWGDDREFAVFDDHGNRVETWKGAHDAVAIDPTGGVVALLDEQNELVVREVGTTRVLGTLSTSATRSARLSLSAAGELVAMCSGGTLVLWRPAIDRAEKRLHNTCSAVVALDAQHVLVGDAQGRIRVVDVDKGIVGMAHHHTDDIVSISASPRGVLVGSIDPGALLYPARPELDPPKPCPVCTARGYTESFVVPTFTTD